MSMDCAQRNTFSTNKSQEKRISFRFGRGEITTSFYERIAKPYILCYWDENERECYEIRLLHLNGQSPCLWRGAT
jgi:hypothetical protein